MNKITKTSTKILGDSLLKNSILLIVSSLFGAFLGFIFWIIASRYYDPKDIGLISAIFSAISLISNIGTIGLPTALIYYLPRNLKNDNKIIDSSLFTCISISIIFSLIFLFGLDIWSPKLTILHDIEFGILFIFLIITTSISGLVGSVFVSKKRSSYLLHKDNLYHILRIFFLMIFASMGLIGMMISLNIGIIISLIISFIFLYRTYNYFPKLKFDPIIKTMTKYSLENYIAGVLYNAPRLILPIMMINIMGAESTGYFYIAFTAASLLHGISGSISTSLLAESFNKEKFEDNINKAITFNILLLIPGILFYGTFGKMFLGIFNQSYAYHATGTLIILSIASIPISLINIYNGIRNSQNRVMSTIIMNLIVAILTIILSVPMMKVGNIESVATAFLMANTIGAIIVIHKIKNPIEFTIKIAKQCRDALSI